MQTTTTCIAAIAHKGKVYIGGDSAGTAGYRRVIRADSKVFEHKDSQGNIFVFGFTSSFRMGQLIQYKLIVPVMKKDEPDLHKFMVTDFIPAVQKCLKDGGFEKKDKEQLTGGTFIVGIHGKIFVIEEDYQVGEPTLNYAAVGCGTDAALGSLYTSDKIAKKMSPEDRIITALEASASCSGAVGAPFKIVHT